MKRQQNTQLLSMVGLGTHGGQARPDGSGSPAASKLLLWALSPFAFTRQTSRLYQDTFLTAHFA